MKILPKIALFAGGVIFGGGLDIVARGIRNKKWSKNFGYPHTPSTYTKTTIKYDDPIFDSINDAVAVIDKMSGIISMYGYATYATLSELCGNDIWLRRGDQNYGWTSIDGFKLHIIPIEPIMGKFKYRLCLPKARNINELEF